MSCDLYGRTTRPVSWGSSSPGSAMAQHPKRMDYEYELRDTASFFMFTEPPTGWQQATARFQRAKSDWAQEVKWLLTHEYAEAEWVILIYDSLNTHTPGAFYEAFPPEVARELLQRLEIRYTAKHGIWLNIAENELSVLTRQCMERYGLILWKSYGNKFKVARVTVMLNRMVWIGNLSIDNTRVKLKSFYPKYLA